MARSNRHRSVSPDDEYSTSPALTLHTVMFTYVCPSVTLATALFLLLHATHFNAALPALAAVVRAVNRCLIRPTHEFVMVGDRASIEYLTMTSGGNHTQVMREWADSHDVYDYNPKYYYSSLFLQRSYLSNYMLYAYVTCYAVTTLTVLAVMLAASTLCYVTGYNANVWLPAVVTQRASSADERAAPRLEERVDAMYEWLHVWMYPLWVAKWACGTLYSFVRASIGKCLTLYVATSSGPFYFVYKLVQWLYNCFTARAPNAAQPAGTAAPPSTSRSTSAPDRTRQPSTDEEELKHRALVVKLLRDNVNATRALHTACEHERAGSRSRHDIVLDKCTDMNDMLHSMQQCAQTTSTAVQQTQSDTSRCLHKVTLLGAKPTTPPTSKPVTPPPPTDTAALAAAKQECRKLQLLADAYKASVVGEKEAARAKSVKYKDELSKHLECYICFTYKWNYAFTPCGHLLCKMCVDKLVVAGKADNCPKCNASVDGTLQLYPN